MRSCYRFPILAQNILIIINIGIDDRFVTIFIFGSPILWWYSNNIDKRLRMNDIITRVRESGKRKNVGKG